MQCIPEDGDGLPDMAALETTLKKARGAPLILGTFTAASNVTGFKPDVAVIARLLHSYGAIAAFDYASAGGCARIDCFGEELDAVMLSPHKLPGGPGACGVLVVRRSLVKSKRPAVAGVQTCYIIRRMILCVVVSV